MWLNICDLTANHPFFDGNKRTALVSTVAVYALNGYSLDYGSEIRLLLKQPAIDESTVPLRDIVEYLAANTAELPTETQMRYEEFLSIASVHTFRRNDYTDEESTSDDVGNR
jgi:death-on-curing protein